MSTFTFGRSDKNRPLDPNKSILESKMVLLGTPAAGKTVYIMSLIQSLIGAFLGNVSMRARCPRELNELLLELQSRMAAFTSASVPPTVKPRKLPFIGTVAGQQILDGTIYDCVGHLLTGATTRSNKDFQKAYEGLLRLIKDADVLQIVLPAVPRDGTQQDEKRFERNIRSVAAFLNEAFAGRINSKRLSITLIASKIDTVSQSPQEARELINCEDLKACFAPLVKLLQHRAVAHAAIIPISSVGFGSVYLKADSRRAPAKIGSADSDENFGGFLQDANYFGEERAYVLKRGATLQPYNVDAAMAYSLLASVLTHVLDESAVNELEASKAMIHEMRDYLKSQNCWFVPVKGDVLAD